MERSVTRADACSSCTLIPIAREGSWKTSRRHLLAGLHARCRPGSQGSALRQLIHPDLNRGASRCCLPHRIAAHGHCQRSRRRTGGVDRVAGGVDPRRRDGERACSRLAVRCSAPPQGRSGREPTPCCARCTSSWTTSRRSGRACKAARPQPLDPSQPASERTQSRWPK